MKAKQPRQTQRDALGLNAAAAGDVHGALVFVSFFSRELSSLGLFSRLPETVGVRLRALGHDAEKVADFIEGYEAALRPTKKASAA